MTEQEVALARLGDIRNQVGALALVNRADDADDTLLAILQDVEKVQEYVQNH